MADDRPNIVLLTSDQQKFTASRMGGNPYLVTRAADRLAAEGVNFRNCFVQSPLCQPSRTSILTGTYPQEHGVMGNSSRMNGVPSHCQMFQESLQANGYTCGAVGHLHANKGFSRGFDWILDMHESPIVETVSPIRDYSEEYAPQTEFGWVGWWCGTSPIPAEASTASVITDQAIDFINRTDGPFYLHISHEDPHPPYMVAPPYDTMYDPADIPLPQDPVWDKAVARLRQLSKEEGMHLCGDDQIRRVIAIYYGMISHVDRQFQRVIDHLEERGVLDNTWIFYTSDHGDFTGEHRMMTKAEMLYDCLLHVPLVIRAPGSEIPAGGVCDEMVEALDLGPTICEAVGIEVPDSRGRSILSVARGETSEPHRDAVFASVGRNTVVNVHNLPQGIAASSRLEDAATMVRTASSKLIHNPNDEYELYLLDEDPDELDNRYGESEVADVQRDLEGRLKSWIDRYPIPPL